MEGIMLNCSRHTRTASILLFLTFFYERGISSATWKKWRKTADSHRKSRFFSHMFIKGYLNNRHLKFDNKEFCLIALSNKFKISLFTGLNLIPSEGPEHLLIKQRTTVPVCVTLGTIS